MKITTSLTKAAAISMLILLAAAGENLAATFTVTNTNDSGAGSLRQALTDSNNTAGSDTIVFDPAVFSTPQTIQLANSIQIFPATGDVITITGPGAHLLTIRGNGVDDFSGQIFLRVGVAHALSLSGMTLTNAGGSAVSNTNNGPQSSLTVTNVTFVGNKNGFGGGGISNAAALTVTNCTFTDNVTSPSGGGSGSLGGGAIHSDTNDVTIPVTITGCTFTNNLAGSTFAGSGGAVNNRSGAMTITNSTFTNNRARNGGGAVANGQILSISGSTISGNSTVGGNADGGAVSSISSGQLTIVDSLLTQNSAGGSGGGIYTAFSGTTNISNSTISFNTANSDVDEIGDGGGMYFRADAGAATISRSTINGNRSKAATTGNSGGGGGIHTSAGRLDLINCTVSGNVAERSGGGMTVLGSVTNVLGCTVANNLAGGSGGIIRANNSTSMLNIGNSVVANNFDSTGYDGALANGGNSLGYNLLENPNTGNTSYGITGDTATNITGVDPNLGPLQNNGGPNFTHALLAGSPAVDKGQSFGLTTDQRGQTRPFDNAAIPNAPNGDGSDIGAVEVTVPVVLGVVSRKTHGTAGTFDINLATTPRGVECRTGPNYQVLVTFTAPVTVGGLSIMSRDGQAGATHSVNGAVVTVNLTGVANAQTLGITLLNVNDGSATGDVFVPVSVLLGDLNGSGSVTASDIGQVKSLSGQSVTGANFRGDVNASGGAIGSSDIGQVKAATGTQLP